MLTNEEKRNVDRCQQLKKQQGFFGPAAARKTARGNLPGGYGFTNMLMKLLEEHSVDYAVAASIARPTR